jgi:hypothetical protein
LFNEDGLRAERLFCSILFLILSLNTVAVRGQVSEKFSAGADFCSSFIWRGTRNGSGPAVQPVLEYSNGLLTAGAWGSFDFRGYQEVDLYLEFDFESGLSLGIQDYYSPDLEYFNFSREDGSHAFELNIGFSNDNFYVVANCILNEAGGMGSSGRDLYFETGYSFGQLTLFAGAGNGWLTYDPETGSEKFKICNTGIQVVKTISVTETFDIPVTGQLIFNPDSEQLFLVVSFTL